MANSVETTGRTVEEAVKFALLKLDATLDEVDIKIVDSGTSGRLLGLGAREARVVVTRRATPYVEGEQEDQPPHAPAIVEEPDIEFPPPLAEEEELAEEPPIEDVSAAATELIEDLLDRMGFDARVEQTADDPPSFNVTAADPNRLEALIGPNGETLRALGFLVNSMLGRIAKRGVRVVVDVNSFRKAREEELGEIARRAAIEVKERREPVTLEAMPAHERRMIHMALADDEEVRTYSIGEGKDRRVVIGPKA